MGNNKNGFIKGALIGALGTLIAGTLVGVSIMTILTSNYQVVNEDVTNKLSEIRTYIDMKFLNDVSDDELVDGMLKGYVAGLGDPYSTYYNVEETKELFESTSGEYSGIGALMSQNAETGVITLVNVFDNSPAIEAGLEDGDILETVNGEEVTGVDLSTVVTQIKGEEGTTVDIGVLRGTDFESIEVTVTRRLVENPTVEYEMKEGNVGYIIVTEFDGVTLEQFALALDDLNNQGMESLIIDLRNNPGGSLEIVCEMLDLLLPKGVLVYTEDKNGNKQEYNASGDDTFDKPLVVMVNEFSASASEIFAGAIQDYEIGTIVGETSFGKGIVQQLIELSDGSLVKLTISEYFTPNGRSINGVGIVPDVEVEDEIETKEVDEQLEKAIEELEK